MEYSTLTSKIKLVELIQNKLKELGLDYTLDELELNKVDDVNNFIEVKLYKKTIDQQIPEMLKHYYKEIKQSFTVEIDDDGNIRIRLTTDLESIYGGTDRAKSIHVYLSKSVHWTDRT